MSPSCFTNSAVPSDNVVLVQVNLALFQVDLATVFGVIAAASSREQCRNRSVADLTAKRWRPLFVGQRV